VRSVYLSTGRFESPHRRAVYRAELAKTRQQIEDGQAPRFDEEELERLRQQRRLVAAVPGRAVLGALVRLFLPALLFLGALNGLLWLVRWLR
jgi:type VI protein secretion system component VasF